MRPALAAILTAVLITLGLAACTSSAGTGPPPTFSPATTLSPPASSAASPSESLVSPAASAPPLDRTAGTYNRVTGTVSPANTGQPPGPCHLRGPPGPDALPDPACTPGGVDPAIGEANLDANLCVPKPLRTRHGLVTLYVLSQHWQDGRPPSSQTTAFKYHVAAPAYGITATADDELDHLVARQLAGSNAGANLWIELGAGIPNKKDAIENRLHDWMCQAATVAQRWGRLQSAQQEIARDWITAPEVLGVPAHIGPRPAATTQARLELAA